MADEPPKSIYVLVRCLLQYIPFFPGSPQHLWAKNELEHIDRDATPWVFVMVHSSICELL